MLDVDDPYAKEELIPCFERVHAGVRETFAALPAESFAARPAPQAWSGAEHLRHLVLSVRPLARALTLPRPLLWLRFGPGRGRSRRYVEMRETYRAALRAGGKASGPYVPVVALPSGGPEALRETLLAQWDGAGAALVDALSGWGEGALDRTRLPHPLLGKLTVREMLLFTLYHDQHHADAVRRLAGVVAIPPGS